MNSTPIDRPTHVPPPSSADREGAPDGARTSARAGSSLPGQEPGMTRMIRRWAHGRPEGDEVRWLALGTAERLEPLEDRLGGLLGGPLRERGLDGIAERVERNPIATLLGAVAALYLVGRALD